MTLAAEDLVKHDGDDFCLIHGRESMYTQRGFPIPFCSKCIADAMDPDNADPEAAAKAAMKNLAES